MKTVTTAIPLALCALIAATATYAQDYPTRPVRLIVASSPGGGTDIAARIIAPKLTEYFGRQVVVDNRPGGTTTIGGDIVAHSPPDGYTLWMGVSSLAINPYILPKVPYDAVKDFAPVSQVAVTPNIMIAHPSLPARTAKELIALAKARPGQLNYAAGGAGSSQHLSMELFLHMAALKIVHVGYRGQGPALLDLVAGHIHLMMSNILSALPHVRTGRLRAIGVTSPKRTIVAPDIPVIAESGLPGYEVIQWYGVLAPAGTPREVIAKIHAGIVRALQDPATRERFLRDGAETVGSTPEEFAALIAADLKKWGKVIKEAKITAH
jgi:tripartite-type tricarboxylate transporter receptor subunit TctC